MSALIAVVDDEPDIVELVSLNLKRAGYRVMGFPDATSFLRYISSNVFDLVILDLMLPDMDGLDVCREIRKSERLRHIPVLMLTARSEELDRVLGLETGADDYVSKPFSPRELVARVKAILRRKDNLAEQAVLHVDDITIDAHRHSVTVAGRRVELTPTEFRILQLLAEKPGWVFSRTQILEHLWGNEKAVLDRTVDVHIMNIRAKLGEAGHLIRNIRGMGYKLETD
ncbi:MAG: response regulator transcription factor [candidate division WOR-3 bacterium]